MNIENIWARIYKNSFTYSVFFSGYTDYVALRAYLRSEVALCNREHNGCDPHACYVHSVFFYL